MSIKCWILAQSLTAALLVPSAAAQQAAGLAAPPTAFEVAVIKPSHVEGDRVMRTIKPLPGGNGYMAQNFPVRLMIALMYRVPLRQVEGGPAWLDDQYYDIEAHADGVHTKDELQAMFRTLLVDRFGLRMHSVEREGKVFALRLVGSESKLQSNPAGPGMRIPIVPVGPSDYVGHGVPMAYLCWFLGQQVQDKERPVIDQTGLTGTYDFHLSFTPDQVANSTSESPEFRDKPPLSQALREQLGLRLDSGVGPVRYYQIDHIERPSAN